jgi:hypothetical protein|tara:strand:- start:434 stop:619 length:186 start_codon:yes stop_codon:yes gene_type:complete
MKHCDVCTYEWKCTARCKCLLGKIKPEEVKIEMPKPIPVMGTRGVVMSGKLKGRPKKVTLQ